MEQTNTETKFEFGPIQTKWLESLENNPERQTNGHLGTKLSDGTYKACCLGELAITAGLAQWNELNELVVFNSMGNSLAYLHGVHDKVGLHSPTGRVPERCQKTYPSKPSLSQLNDNGKTWPEIAAIVRENPEDYFFKSV